MKSTQSEIYVTKGIMFFFYLFSSIWRSRGRIILPPCSRAALQQAEERKKLLNLWLLLAHIGSSVCSRWKETLQRYLRMDAYVFEPRILNNMIFFFYVPLFRRKKNLKPNCFLSLTNRRHKILLAGFYFFALEMEMLKQIEIFLGQ